MYLTQGLHRSLQQTPGATALVGPATSLSFSELVDRVARLASGLRGLGLEPGDRVGVLADNSTQYVESVLAVPWAGLVISPVNVRWSLQEIRYQLRDAGIVVLLIGIEQLTRFGDELSADPGLRLVVMADPDRTGAVSGTMDHDQLIGSSTPMEDTRGSTALAALVYTGGTTGSPKGVMLSHRQIAISSLGVIASLGDTSAHRFLHAGPLYHLAALGALYTQVALGSTHLVIGRYTVADLVDHIRAHEVTATTLVPTVVQRLLEYLDDSGLRLPSLRALGYGGAPIGEQTLRAAQQLLPEAGLSQRYGMSELGPIASILRPEDHRPGAPGHRLRSAGRPALHAEIRIADPADASLPAGEVGEILVRGGHVMMGYWGKPEQTAQAVRGGWMHTGDVGYLDADGYLYVVDRLKDMIVSGGENVYSTEVEQVVGLHPAVRECAVIGVADHDWGERVHAVVVLEEGATLDLIELREFCCAQVARYKAPRSMSVVPALPVSAVGKVLKRELRRVAEAG